MVVRLEPLCSERRVTAPQAPLTTAAAWPIHCSTGQVSIVVSLHDPSYFSLGLIRRLPCYRAAQWSTRFPQKTGLLRRFPVARPARPPSSPRQRPRQHQEVRGGRAIGHPCVREIAHETPWGSDMAPPAPLIPLKAGRDQERPGGAGTHLMPRLCASHPVPDLCQALCPQTGLIVFLRLRCARMSATLAPPEKPWRTRLCAGGAGGKEESTWETRRKRRTPW